MKMSRTIANISTIHTLIQSITTTNVSASVKPEGTTEYKLRGVVDANGCTPSVIDGSVTVAVLPLPGTPEVINGDDVVCQGQQSVVYTTKAVDYATGYQWILPSGMTILAGDGSKTITVNIEKDFVGGMLKVRALNDCDGSEYREKLISVNHLPVKPAAIVAESDYCQAQKNIRISVPTVKYATTYEWDLPCRLYNYQW